MFSCCSNLLIFTVRSCCRYSWICYDSSPMMFCPSISFSTSYSSVLFWMNRSILLIFIMLIIEIRMSWNSSKNGKYVKKQYVFLYFQNSRFFRFLLVSSMFCGVCELDQQHPLPTRCSRTPSGRSRTAAAQGCTASRSQTRSSARSLS